jgi:hypothetical protein
MPDLARKCSALAAAPPNSRELLVAVFNISKCFGRTTAVAGGTLTMWSGEICGFIGAQWRRQDHHPSHACGDPEA